MITKLRKNTYTGALSNYGYNTCEIGDLLAFLKQAKHPDKIWIADNPGWLDIDVPNHYDTYIFG